MMCLASCIRMGRPRRAQLGLSLLEVAITLVIAGLMSWAAFSGYGTVSAQQKIERGRAQANHLQSVVRAFSLRYGRLPCPSLDTRGYESLDGVGNCTVGTQRGFFPYVSLGLELPTNKIFPHYAVFRAANVVLGKDADLAVVEERTGDSAGDTLYKDVTDLIVALNNASNQSLVTTQPYLTGVEGAAGAINCTNNQVMAVAYWLIVSLEDKDADGSRLDSPHTETGLCVASPSAPLRFAFDDVVVAESPAQLAGWLRKSLP